jgi:hypothetical protein
MLIKILYSFRTTFLLFEFTWIGINNCFKIVLYQNSYFIHVFDVFVIFTVSYGILDIYVSIYFDVKREISRLMILSFYMYSR